MYQDFWQNYGIGKIFGKVFLLSVIMTVLSWVASERLAEILKAKPELKSLKTIWEKGSDKALLLPGRLCGHTEFKPYLIQGSLYFYLQPDSEDLADGMEKVCKNPSISWYPYLSSRKNLSQGLFVLVYFSAQIQVQSASHHMEINSRWIHPSLWWMIRT